MATVRERTVQAGRNQSACSGEGLVAFITVQYLVLILAIAYCKMELQSPISRAADKSDLVVLCLRFTATGICKDG